MAAIAIKNTNEASKFALKNWNTGLAAASGAEATVDADFPVVAGEGTVKIRFWETEQFVEIAAGATLNVTTDSDAETAYYEGLNGVAGLEVTKS